MPEVTWYDRLADWGWQLFMTAAVAAFGWVFYVERRIGSLRLHVSENYVKKTDITALEQRIAAEFKEVKDGNNQILDLLLGARIGSKGKHR
jgi:cell division protein FtsL